ncbi:MAG TPA: AraC family transcriptional regulator, partial [Humisphaera sp.]|nr:AraC family transcriptional regulator [Humisphaera sp.]
HSVRFLLDSLKKAAPFQSGLVLTTVPRGGLQIAQPSNVPDALLKSYSKGFHTEDRISWQAILKRKAIKPSDAYKRDEFEATPFVQALMEPAGLKYAVALPVAAPVFDGYPGVVHLFRSADESDFSGADVQKLLGAVRQFDERRQQSRQPRKGAPQGGRLVGEVPEVRLAIVDSKLKPIFGSQTLSALDAKLRQQLLDRAKRRMHQINGHGSSADRVQFPDSHGDMWVFTLVAYKHYPALGDGSFTFFCLQPGVSDWSAVKPQDFQADAELSRLIPALKFMATEFRRGPTLPEIAREVQLSPFHFHRRFTELLGLTPKEFMSDCQIHECKTELLGGEKELAEIARENGFAHQSHFTSRFKQATGLTPTRWRRMAAERKKTSNN